MDLKLSFHLGIFGRKLRNC